jgi:ornithine carbamoyltransferase
MHPTLSHYGDLAFDPLAPRDVGIVLENARGLQRAAEAGGLRPLLRGRKLGLLCEAKGGDEAVLFCRAAAELGAHVAHIRPSLTELSPPQEVRHTSQMLGRLYDAVECQGMSAVLVHQMGVDAGVPIFDGVASQTHPTARLADLIAGDASQLDKRCIVVQAVLLSTIN